MVLWFVILYLIASIAIGLFVATRVHNTKDFAVAGRHLPTPVVMATVFATWFGSEAIFGVSASFVQKGLGGVVADPFGTSLCLMIAGVIFATKLYKLNVLTLGDFFRGRYNRTVEILTTVCIVVSYIGWVSAQIKALGLIFSILTDGALSQEAGMIIGIAIVLTYTSFGGMLSVAVLDFIQMGIIMGGLLYIASIVSGLSGGFVNVVSHAADAGKLDFFPKANLSQWLAFIGLWVTTMFGSIPQQDVFQRITSAKSAKVAISGSFLGASIYFCFCFVPMFIAFSATLIDPEMFNRLIEIDEQLILPSLVIAHTPEFAQVIFFGAVLAAIMSCSSATLLAPSVAFSENILRHFIPDMDDRRFLMVMRLTTLGFAAIVLTYAMNTDKSIMNMVESAYKITLAGAFVPLIAGAYWKRATTQGALVSIASGIGSWLILELTFGEDSLVPPQLSGFGISIIGMIIGSYLPQWIGIDQRKEESQERLSAAQGNLQDMSDDPESSTQ